jgi:hypothetical protein
MSPSGLVVGYSGALLDYTAQPWSYDPESDQVTELPRLPNSDSVPLDINDAGTAVGYALVNGAGYVPVLWSGSPPALKELDSRSCSGEAHAINNHGLIAGSLCQTASTKRAVQWPSSTALPIDLADGSGIGVTVADVNDAGVIVAQIRYISGDSGTVRGALWSKDGTALDLGRAIPQAINASGLVVGSRNGTAVKIDWRAARATTIEPL